MLTEMKVKNKFIDTHSKKSTLELKEQLDELIGPSDFKKDLEKVNIIISIIITLFLFLFFLNPT